MMSSRVALVVAANTRRLAVRAAAPHATDLFNLCGRSSTTTPSARFYSTTTPLGKKKKDDDDDDGDEFGELEMMNAGDMTQEEARAIIEEEWKLLQELEADKYVVPPDQWKPGMRKRKLMVSRSLEEMERDMAPHMFEPRWTTRDKRCGALAIKVGMIPIWDPVWGERIATTVLFVDTNIVLAHKTIEKHGYTAVTIAAGERKRKNVRKSVLGQYNNILDGGQESTENPPYLMREFRVTDPENLPPLYSRIHARHFVPGQQVDVAGISKGKGFQGGMKLHGFGGMPASHGVSKSHRALGSIGQCQDPGRVFKGKKMPGRMGNNRVTVQNLRIIKIDRGRNLLYIKGHIPGQKGNWVEIRDAIKKPLWNTDMVEGGLDKPPLPTFDYTQDILDGTEDTIVDGSGELGYEVFMPIGKEDPLDPDYRNTLTQLKSDE